MGISKHLPASFVASSLSSRRFSQPHGLCACALMLTALLILNFEPLTKPHPPTHRLHAKAS